MTPIFEFEGRHPIEVIGWVIVNPAGGIKDSELNDTDIFLPLGTPMSAVEEITDSSEQLKSVSLRAGDPSSNLVVNGEEQPSVIIPTGHKVQVHSM